MQSHPNYHFLHFDVIDSTNEEAKRFLKNNDLLPKKNLLFVANQQTAGRGRRGRSWVSEKGNLYCTFVLNTSLLPQQFPLLSFAATIALKKTIEQYITQGKISYKWPNDILVDDKKIAGILLETSSFKNQPVVMVGIGLNIAHFPDNIGYAATKLSDYSGQKIETLSLIHYLVEQFDAQKRLLECKGFSQIHQLWLEDAKGIGKEIEVRLANQHYSGIFKRLGQAGELVLLLQSGEEKQIMAGDVFF